MASLLLLLFLLLSSQAAVGSSPDPSLAPPTLPDSSHDGRILDEGLRRTISFLSAQSSTQSLLTTPTASQEPIRGEVASSRATIGPTLPQPSSDVTVVEARPRPQREEGSDLVPPDTPVSREKSRFHTDTPVSRERSGFHTDAPDTVPLSTERSGFHTDTPVSTEKSRFHSGASSLKMSAGQTPTALSVTFRPTPTAPAPTAAPFDPTAAPFDPTAVQTTQRTGLLTANTPAERQESSTVSVEPTTSEPTRTSTTSEPTRTPTTSTTSEPTRTSTTPRTSTLSSVEKASSSPGAVSISTQRNGPRIDPQPNSTQPNTWKRTTQPSTRTGTSTPAVHVNITLRPTRTGRTTTTTTSTKTGTTSHGGPPPNATMLLWADLCRTLSFAWPLHVYGSACLFLLLFAGAALGLMMSPGMRSPHRGALCLANALLLLAGGLRACLFLMDPYGSRLLLPRAALSALYNLPLPLLVWSEAALALLALRQAELRALEVQSLEKIPLAAVMSVLQCTLLLAVDLLSSALSPAVPVTLQVLSLLWGLLVCLGFLCYVFPRLRSPPAACIADGPEAGGKPGSGSPGGPDPEADGKPGSGSVGSEAECEAERKGEVWRRSGRRSSMVLGRVLAVCALLGALCCGLHVHATLWLYGLLGEWRRFNWGWWLVHFWARLLELAWGFSLLLLGSWVFWRPVGGPGVCKEESWAFWRPVGGPGCEEGGPGDSRTGGELPSPGGQSTASAQRHTCWSKIVQSLTGKSCKKSDSNGLVSGPAGVAAAGEAPPNNWAGLVVSPAPPGGGGGGGGGAADISKSLIRNQSNSNSQSQESGNNKNSNQQQGRNLLRARSADRSTDRSASLLRLQALGGGPRPNNDASYSSLSLSLCDFDLRPPSPIELGRSIDEALHRHHLLGEGSLFQPLSLGPSSPYRPPDPPWDPPSPPSNPWGLRRNGSDPQLLSESSSSQSSAPLGGGSAVSSVPSRQVTEPPTPSRSHHDGATTALPSSVSCPVSLQHRGPSTRTSSMTGPLCEDDTRPFLTPDSNRLRGGRAGRGAAGSRSRMDDSNSVSSEIIDL